MTRQKYIMTIAAIIAATISLIGGIVFFFGGAVAELRSAGTTDMFPIWGRGLAMVAIGVIILGIEIKELT